MNSNIHLFIENIESLHNDIEAVFTQQPLNTEALESIKKRLSTDFSMVGISGKEMSYNDVINAFRQNAGKRSGLKIKTGDYKIIYQSDCMAAVRYLETHDENKKILTRVSIVLLKRNSHDNCWQWSYLHETPIMSN